METIALLFGSALAVLFIVVGIRALIAGAASRHWRQVPGTVREVVIEQQMRAEDADRYTARVDYEYMFEGRAQRDSQKLGQWSPDREVAVRYGSSYAAGQQVFVAVDPANPRKSTLTPGPNYGYLVPVVFGAIMLVFFLSRLLAA